MRFVYQHNYLVTGIVWLLLALPPALAHRSWKRFFLALPLSFVGVFLPLFVFGMSMGLVPEWKGKCSHGWIDCFHEGKLALTPLVLWATAALYAVEIWRVANRLRRWIVLGFFIGAMVSSICLVYGMFCNDGMLAWLLVPLYVSVWYSVRAIQLVKAAPFKPAEYVIATCGSLPFWIWAVIWSRRTYAALPDKPPDCFVVTAAMRGHRQVVGPFFEVTHGGHILQANQQLMTLWRFEAQWCVYAPRSHAGFRQIYNRLGPVVARNISGPLVADFAYFLLKPVEFLAKVFLSTVNPGK